MYVEEKSCTKNLRKKLWNNLWQESSAALVLLSVKIIIYISFFYLLFPLCASPDRYAHYNRAHCNLNAAVCLKCWLSARSTYLSHGSIFAVRIHKRRWFSGPYLQENHAYRILPPKLLEIKTCHLTHVSFTSV